MSYNTIMEAVENALALSRPAGLEIEVLTSALIQLQENPDLPIEEALQLGLNEWIK